MSLAATWMDIETIILSEINQAEKDKYHMILLILIIYKNLTQMNLFTKQKQTHRFREWIYGYQWGRVRARDRLGVWVWN